MCGIAAIIGKNASEKQLVQMLEEIRHRGESRYFNESSHFNGCALGMNRLAIVDREHAKQPMQSEDGRYHIVFNGEIYNYKELQTELVKEGRSFLTDSDTEVLVQGYAAWGSALLQKVRGMFAFIIYDAESGTFFAARDPFGVKPLYYATTKDGTFYLGSEIKALSCLKAVNEVKLFPPATYMQDGKLEVYWHMGDETQEYSEEEMIKTLRELFDRAVQRRVQTDLPIAVYLSGGIDSTAVLATAKKYHPNVTAIIMGTEQSSDRITAVKYCEEESIPYIVKEPPNEEELAKLVPDIVRITESFEPNMVRQSTLSYQIAMAAAKGGFKVILCGEGSDELFAGYPEFATLDEQSIEKKTRSFLSDLHRTQLQRVDRTSMAFTTEVREPFLDVDFASYVLSIPAKWKVKMKDGKSITKYILRKAMEDRLPAYIAHRDKVVLSEGAGFKGNQPVGGLLYDITNKQVSDEECAEYKAKYADWHLETNEEVYYFKQYIACGYLKATFNQQRTVVNRVPSIGEAERLAEKIVEQFNVRRFRREQPRTVQSLLEKVEKHVDAGQPIEFIMYWGKGDRNSIAEPEKEAIALLRDMEGAIKAVYPTGMSLQLIVTDTHAQLNGYDAEGVAAYYESVKAYAQQFGIHVLRMSDIVVYNEAQVRQNLSTVHIPDGLATLIKETSTKHYKGADPGEGAKLYYLQNQPERTAIEKRYPDSIFLTYNSSDWNPIFPEALPVFYMHSLKRGVTMKPWFMP